MAYLALVRHGQSQWNLENRFTGWVDIPLSVKGEEEAKAAGRKLSGFHFDIAYTSVLVRATRTLDLMMREMGQTRLPIVYDAALNERMYGQLQGMNKDETRQKYGAQQVQLWRRSYDVRPPGGEALKDTAARALPFFEGRIMADLKAGKNVLVSAHGNSLRAIVMRLDRLTPAQVAVLEIPTGVPYVYEFDRQMNVIKKEIKTR